MLLRAKCTYLEALQGGGFWNAVQREWRQGVGWDSQSLLTVEPAAVGKQFTSHPGVLFLGWHDECVKQLQAVAHNTYKTKLCLPGVCCSVCALS